VPGGARGWEKRRGFMGGLAPFFYNRGLGWVWVWPVLSWVWVGLGLDLASPDLFFIMGAGLVSTQTRLFLRIDGPEQPAPIKKI